VPRPPWSFWPIVGAYIKYLSPQLYIYLQSVQAYIQSADCRVLIFGILWPRLNGQGAISSLLTGFVLGAVRFLFEVLDKSSITIPGHPLAGGHELLALCHINVRCLQAVLIGVSMMYPAPERKRSPDLLLPPWATNSTPPMRTRPISKGETPTERMFNLAFTGC